MLGMHRLVLLGKEMATEGQTLNAAVRIAGPSINNLQTQASEPSKGGSSPNIECLARMRHSANYISLVNKCVFSRERLSLKLTIEGHTRNW